MADTVLPAILDFLYDWIIAPNHFDSSYFYDLNLRSKLQNRNQAKKKNNFRKYIITQLQQTLKDRKYLFLLSVQVKQMK